MPADRSRRRTGFIWCGSTTEAAPEPAAEVATEARPASPLAALWPLKRGNRATEAVSLPASETVVEQAKAAPAAESKPEAEEVVPVAATAEAPASGIRGKLRSLFGK